MKGKTTVVGRNHKYREDPDILMDSEDRQRWGEEQQKPLKRKLYIQGSTSVPGVMYVMKTCVGWDGSRDHAHDLLLEAMLDAQEERAESPFETWEALNEEGTVLHEMDWPPPAFCPDCAEVETSYNDYEEPTLCRICREDRIVDHELERREE